MGSFTSRQNAGLEETDVISNHAYRYPPRSGNYFGSHFIMGGERFDTPQPEAYLFGENADLNFLGSRPTPFPYPPPQSNEPTKTLKSLVNIRKESLRFVRCPDSSMKASDGGEGDVLNKSTLFNIEFTFDCDARCLITIYYFCTEEITSAGVTYYPRDPSMNSQTYRYKRGANQQFCQTSHVFDPIKYSEEDLVYNSEKETIPIAIHCIVDEGSDEMRQSHTTIAVIEKHSDGTFVLKALKQKLFVDGLDYLLQEIYGIENKNNDTKINSDEETEDNGSECVICMCDVRDTLILPCRHLCLCNSCADSLRYQANNCPICRAPFRALLQIRALQKVSGQPLVLPASPPDESMDNIPAGYEAVSLIEALNGPNIARSNVTASTPQPLQLGNTTPSPDGENVTQAAEILNRSNLENNSSGSLGSGCTISGKSKHSLHSATSKSSPKDIEGKTPRDRSLAQGNNSEQFRMSVLLAREEDTKIAASKNGASSPLLINQNKSDKIRINNEDRANKKQSNGDYCLDDIDLDADAIDQEGEGEGDSEAEKLSPLLTSDSSGVIFRNSGSSGRVASRGPSCEDFNIAQDEISEGENGNRLPLHIEAVLEPIDDTDTDEPEQSSNASIGVPVSQETELGTVADDSDYFTPEDTHTTILSTPRHPHNGKTVLHSAS